MSSYDPFTDDSAHVSVGHVQMRLGYIAHCLGIPAATLSALRSGEMVAVPRERLEAAEEACREAWGWEYEDADPSTAALVRWHQLAAAKDARHD